MEDVRRGILNCAKRYRELLEKQVSYEIEFFSKETEEIQRLTVCFVKSEFKHLIGFGKLNGITDSSEKMYDKLNGIFKGRGKNSRQSKISAELAAENIVADVEYDEYFYDDLTRKAELSKEEYEIESGKQKDLKHYFRSDMVDRMSALEHFYDTMNRMQLDGTSVVSLKMYRWLRNDGTSTIQEKRPRGSTIDADYLFEFEESGTLPEKPYVDFFVKKSDTSGKNPNVSIFKSEETYSDDTAEFKAGHPRLKSRALEDDIIVLSVTRTMLENGKEVSETKTADSRVITECQKLVQARIEKQEQAERNREARKNPHEDEKSTATKVLRNLKATRCRDKDSKKAEYRKELCSLHDKTDYTLHEIRYVLENSCTSKNNEKNREQMEKEIRLIDGILKAREIIAEMTAVEQETTENNFFEQAEKYVALQNSIRAEVNRSDMQTILCHNIAEMLEQHEISNADETVKSTISFEYAEKFKADIRQISEEKTGTVISLNFRKPAEFRNISSDGTAVMDMVSSLKQTFEEAGKQVMEYAEKLKCFLKKTVQFLADRFRKKHDDSEESAESPPNSPVKENNSHFSSEHEESEKQNQYVYLITEELELHGFFERTADGYSEIIAEKKFVSETEMQENLHWQGRVQEHICEEQNHLETELSCRKNSYDMER